MKLKAILDRIQHETNVVQGEETKDKVYSSQNTFPDESTALDALGRSKEKLLNVNSWSGLSRFTADFILHDQQGLPKLSGTPQVGDYIQIVLPGPIPKNWVRVIRAVTEEKRVELVGQTITASEIGKNEGINNQEPQAGEHAIINTVVAEAGWLFYQEIQWKLLTDYLVHSETEGD